MRPYGYEVLICYNCARADAPRIVAGAKKPPKWNPKGVPGVIDPIQIPPAPDGPRGLWMHECPKPMARIQGYAHLRGRSTSGQLTSYCHGLIAKLPDRCCQSRLGHHRSS